jgi:hypothetical protein
VVVEFVKLSRAQRAKLLNGEPASISGTGDAPVKKGHVHRISNSVDLKVVRVDISTDARGKRWSLHYELHDRRDPIRLLRRTPPVSHPSRSDFDEHGYPLPQEAHETADTSHYAAGGAVVADAGEAIPRSAQDAYTVQAKMEGQQANAARRLQYEQRHVLTRLAHALSEADRLGIDPARAVARIEAGVAKLERDVGRAGQQRNVA